MVAGLLDRAAGGTPALTRPSVTLTFGAGGGAGGLEASSAGWPMRWD